MKHNVEYKNFSPTAPLRQLIEESIARMERHAPDLPDKEAFLRLVIEQNDARTLYRVALTVEVPGTDDVPGRTLAAHPEHHHPEEAIREAFREVERQLEGHKAAVKASWTYKRPARRDELRRKKGKAPLLGPGT